METFSRVKSRKRRKNKRIKHQKQQNNYLDLFMQNFLPPAGKYLALLLLVVGLFLLKKLFGADLNLLTKLIEQFPSLIYTKSSGGTNVNTRRSYSL